MALFIDGIPAFERLAKAFMEKQEKKIVDLRKKVAHELTNALLENIPVWSGRTVASMKWSNNGDMSAMVPHPDRGNTSPQGYYRYHPEFGHTNTMQMGDEPMRGAAEALARGTLQGVSFALDAKLTVTINSTAWGLVEQARAPGGNAGSARNTAVVSELAKAQVRAKFPGVV